MLRCIVTTTKRYAKNNVLYPVPQYAVWSPQYNPYPSTVAMNGVFLRKPQPHEIAESEEEETSTQNTEEKKALEKFYSGC